MTARPAQLLLRTIRRAHGAEPNDRELLRRFADARDESALAALVRRHGGLVYGVCRRVLRDAHAAEDSFQATFLILARRAGSRRWHDSVAGWLYRVARRLAVRARSAADRRTVRESRLPPPPNAADPLDAVTGRELCAVVDEEL